MADMLLIAIITSICWWVGGWVQAGGASQQRAAGRAVGGHRHVDLLVGGWVVGRLVRPSGCARGGWLPPLLQPPRPSPPNQRAACCSASAERLAASAHLPRGRPGAVGPADGRRSLTLLRIHARRPSLSCTIPTRLSGRRPRPVRHVDGREPEGGPQALPRRRRLNARLHVDGRRLAPVGQLRGGRAGQQQRRACKQARWRTAAARSGAPACAAAAACRRGSRSAAGRSAAAAHRRAQGTSRCSLASTSGRRWRWRSARKRRRGCGRRRGTRHAQQRTVVPGNQPPPDRTPPRRAAHRKEGVIGARRSQACSPSCRGTSRRRRAS